ncbi:hypothetical protein [Nocardia transvalensis]|uniref:hypothetical protein n=1 Tax=Nocardia transvalensis TaxID=37333 RepID=UPI0018951672|nr:hypothetical protein [Nocardia transvalensis]MBF6330861.1 hypothetical protein [Nocardia transvalensis]
MSSNVRKPALAVCYALLRKELSKDVVILTDIDQKRPDRFVKISRVGGPRYNAVTDGPMFMIECWCTGSAEEMAMHVASVFELCLGRYVEYQNDAGESAYAFISSYREVGGPVRHLDPDVSSQDRWTMTVRLGISSNV